MIHLKKFPYPLYKFKSMIIIEIYILRLTTSCLKFFESLILHLCRNVTKGGDNEALVVGELPWPEPGR